MKHILHRISPYLRILRINNCRCNIAVSSKIIGYKWFALCVYLVWGDVALCCYHGSQTRHWTKQRYSQPHSQIPVTLHAEDQCHTHRPVGQTRGEGSELCVCVKQGGVERQREEDRWHKASNWFAILILHVYHWIWILNKPWHTDLRLYLYADPPPPPHTHTGIMHILCRHTNQNQKELVARIHGCQWQQKILLSSTKTKQKTIFKCIDELFSV